MTLQEVFDQLMHGELSQIHLGSDQGQGQIDESNWKMIVSHLNMGLSALYKRFNLKDGRVVVELHPSLLQYPLKSRYAQSNVASTEPIKFIKDASSPFQDDILKVERVLTDLRYELGLNDPVDPYAIQMTTMRSLRVPDEIVNWHVGIPEEYKTETLEIWYRADHPKIVLDATFFDPADLELELPDLFMEPLVYYIASRIHNPIGIVNEFNAGNNYAAKYEMACQFIEQKSLHIDSVAGNDRLYRGGWV